MNFRNIIVFLMLTLFAVNSVNAVPSLEQRLAYCKDSFIYSSATINNDLLLVEASENGFNGEKELDIAVNAANTAFYKLKAHNNYGATGSTFDWAVGKIRQNIGASSNMQGLWVSSCFDYLQKAFN